MQGTVSRPSGLSGHDPPVTGDDAVVVVDQDWVIEAELAD